MKLPGLAKLCGLVDELKAGINLELVVTMESPPKLNLNEDSTVFVLLLLFSTKLFTSA